MPSALRRSLHSAVWDCTLWHGLRRSRTVRYARRRPGCRSQRRGSGYLPILRGVERVVRRSGRWRDPGVCRGLRGVLSALARAREVRPGRSGLPFGDDARRRVAAPLPPRMLSGNLPQPGEEAALQSSLRRSRIMRARELLRSSRAKEPETPPVAVKGVVGPGFREVALRVGGTPRDRMSPRAALHYRTARVRATYPTPVSYGASSDSMRSIPSC